MDMQACTETLRTRMGESSGLNATLKFDCGDAGVIFLDGRSMPNAVGNEDRDADCTIAISHAKLVELLTGELEPTTGFMMGHFKVSGDISVAMKLQRVL